METNTLAVAVDDDQEEVARKIGRYDMLALPVVDSDGRIVGIVTHDDALDVIEEETTDDFHRVGTVTNLASTVGEATIAMLYRARIMWLVLLVFGNIFSGAGISYFEDTLAANLTLMFFLPMLIASGGNAGAQSATLMVRALATGGRALFRLGLSDPARGGGFALALGLTMAAAVSLLGFWRGGSDLALTVSLSMILHRDDRQPDRHVPTLRAGALQARSGHRLGASGHLYRRCRRRGDLLPRSPRHSCRCPAAERRRASARVSSLCAARPRF